MRSRLARSIPIIATLILAALGVRRHSALRVPIASLHRCHLPDAAHGGTDWIRCATLILVLRTLGRPARQWADYPYLNTIFPLRPSGHRLPVVFSCNHRSTDGPGSCHHFATRFLGPRWQGDGHRNRDQRLPAAVAPLPRHDSSVTFLFFCYGLEKQKAPLEHRASCGSRSEPGPILSPRETLLLPTVRCLAFADWARGGGGGGCRARCRTTSRSAQVILSRRRDAFCLEGEDQFMGRWVGDFVSRPRGQSQSRSG